MSTEQEWFRNGFYSIEVPPEQLQYSTSCELRPAVQVTSYGYKQSRAAGGIGR